MALSSQQKVFVDDGLPRLTTLQDFHSAAMKMSFLKKALSDFATIFEGEIAKAMKKALDESWATECFLVSEDYPGVTAEEIESALKPYLGAFGWVSCAVNKTGPDIGARFKVVVRYVAPPKPGDSESE